MTCINPDCKTGKPGLHPKGSKVGHICEPCYRELRIRYSIRIRDNVSTAVRRDITKLHILLHIRSDLCIQYLQRTEQELSGARGKKMGVDPRFAKPDRPNALYLKLSRALEYYEGYCFWPATRQLITGILSPEDFLASNAQGHAKDVGGGTTHGDQAHRLQWHVISRAVTNNFETPIDRASGWSHSPLQLFLIVTEDKNNMWGELLDDSRHPNFGGAENTQLTVLGQAKQLPMISGALRKRIDTYGGILPNPAKRSGIDRVEVDSYINKLPAAIKAFFSEQTRPPPSLVSPKDLATRKYVADNHLSLEEPIAQLLYEWKKTGSSKYRKPIGTKEKVIEKTAMFECARYVLHCVFNNDLSLPNAPKSGIPAIQPDISTELTSSGGNYVATSAGSSLLNQRNAPDLNNAMDIKTRAANSQKSFNIAQYRYSDMLGAEPKTDERW